MNRKEFLRASAAVAALALLPGSAHAETNADQALNLLREGNRRYLEGLKTGMGNRGQDRRTQVSQTQRPHAIILSCADSRVAPEVFFDSGIGELFVVRIAGNIVSGSNYGVIGSCEFAAAVLESPLLVVVGHENCGAVKAAIDTIDRKSTLPGAIEDIVEAIRPAAQTSQGQAGDALHNAIVENVKNGMKRLPSMSSLLSERIAGGKLKVTGAVYDLESGRVEFL